MHRFYCPNANLQSSFIDITDKKEIHHLKDVLRLKEGGGIALFDGKGSEVQGAILSIKTECVRIRIDSLSESTQRANTKLILACAIPKKAKFETIIEKCTELGVDEIVPLKTQRTEFTLGSERLEKKHFRYQTVGINAAKQSKRPTLPLIHPVTEFSKAVKTFITPGSCALIPHLSGKRKSLVEITKEWGTQPSKIIIFIGPEGDFTPAEVATAVNAGCIPISLGQTTLKVDTAAIAVTSFLRLHLSL